MSAQVPRLSQTSRQDQPGVTPRSHEQSTKLPRTRYTRVQLLLFIAILTAAYALNPQLEIQFIMTCVSALFGLLLVRLVVSCHTQTAHMHGSSLLMLADLTRTEFKFQITIHNTTVTKACNLNEWLDCTCNSDAL